MGDWWDRQVDRLGSAYEWGIAWDLSVWQRGGWWRALAVLLAPVQLVSIVLTNVVWLAGGLVWAAVALVLAAVPLVLLALVIVALMAVFEPGGQEAAPAAPASSSGASECELSYPHDCLDPDAIDYDCAGGEGDGPRYVDGPLTVIGPDPFGLDGEGDGLGCESQGA